MPSYRWSRLIPILCVAGTATWSTAASAFQYPPLSDDLNTRHMHRAEDWVGGAFPATDIINQPPADYGPISGMWSRTPDGNPASGDNFRTMQTGPLPGGFSPHGFNGSGMIPPVNQPDHITNNPVFGGNGQMPDSPNSPNGPFSNNATFGPNGLPNASANRALGVNPWANPYGPPPQMARTARPQTMSSSAAIPPFVGLLGQVARPGVYELVPGRVSLGELIEQIGGLSQEASGQFRIIRNGRPGQTTSYSAAAYFELMPGDLVIVDTQAGRTSDAMPGRDSQSAQRELAARQASAGAVQFGFVNLVNRPVVLKLRSEHASVSAILAIMRQDSALASYVTVVPPPNHSQRFSGPPRPDVLLPSETVLIFPPNSIATERLVPLPEPIKIDRDPNERPDAIAVPPPPADGFASSRGNRFTPQQPSGVRGSARNPAFGSDRDSQDANKLLAPPAEESAPGAESSHNQPTASLPIHDVPAATATHNAAEVPEPPESSWTDSDDHAAEPSLLNAEGKRRPIGAANNHDANSTTRNGSDLDEVEASTGAAASRWSIWPPILTGGVGLVALLGFSLLLRRRTQQATPPSDDPRPTRPPLGLTRLDGAVAQTPAAPRGALAAGVGQQSPNYGTNYGTTPTSKHELLEGLINNHLPLTEEKVVFASPLQFHGRPVPPQSLRRDDEHPLPRPHAPNSAPAAMPRPQPAPVGAATSASTGANYRIDRLGATVSASTNDRFGPASGGRPASEASANIRSTSTTANVSAGSRPPLTGSASGLLDRALLAVQRREDHA